MKLLLALLALFATPALAKPSFSIADTSCTLGLHCVFTVTKTGLATSYSDIPFATKGAAGQAVSVTLRFLKADTVKTVAVASVAPGQFTATIKILRYGNIARGTAVGTVTAPVPAQAPPPVVAPPAPMPPGWIASPSLDGLPDPVGVRFDLAAATQPSWGSGAIPASSAPDVLGAFRMVCRDDAGENNDDVIVYPGQPGKSHAHQYYGRILDAFSTFDQMRLSGTSLCQVGVADPANRSAYWTAALLDPNGQRVKPVYVLLYYKRRPASDPKCSLTSGDPKAEGNCVGLPNGLREIAGANMANPAASPKGSYWFNCQGPTAKPGTYFNLVDALANCPTGQGNLLGELLEFQSCWDGKNLDSPDHRSHIAYPGYGTWGYERCDAAHPYVIPRLTQGIWFPSPPLGSTLSCDQMWAMLVPGSKPGECLHADYFPAWEPSVKAMWTDNCINKMLNCSGGDLGNGLQLKGAQ